MRGRLAVESNVANGTLPGAGVLWTGGQGEATARDIITPGSQGAIGKDMPTKNSQKRRPDINNQATRERATKSKVLLRLTRARKISAPGHNLCQSWMLLEPDEMLPGRVASV